MGLFKFKGENKDAFGLGVFFSGIGDILLELPFDGLFEAGMAAFILAHCFYIALFLARPKLTPVRGLVMGGMVVFTLWFGAFLFPGLKGMMVPIYVYLGVILCMGISACLGRDNHWMVIAGAIVFIISDSLIAWTRFVTPIPHSSLWVMLTYYLAQAMLALGVFRSYPNIS
ncbi:MAG: lysoplasmalogenase [Desulfobacter sp.]|nr:MAG: lysoplasmalogenase [Desulfobacter sp.]